MSFYLNHHLLRLLGPDGGGGGGGDAAAQLAEMQRKMDAARAEADAARAEAQRLKDERVAAENTRKQQELEAKGAYEEAKAQLEQEKAALAREREQSMIEVALTKEAVKQGLKSERYISLADKSLVKIEGGNVVGADKAIEALKKSGPELFGGTTPADGSSRQPGHSDGSDFVKAQLERAKSKLRSDIPREWANRKK